MDVAKLLPRDYYSLDEDEMQPKNSFTVQLTGGITEGITGGITGGISSVRLLSQYF